MKKTQKKLPHEPYGSHNVYLKKQSVNNCLFSFLIKDVNLIRIESNLDSILRTCS